MLFLSGVYAFSVIPQNLACHFFHSGKQFIAHIWLAIVNPSPPSRSECEPFARIIGHVPLGHFGFAIFNQQHYKRILEQFAHLRQLTVDDAREHFEGGREVIFHVD